MSDLPEQMRDSCPRCGSNNRKHRQRMWLNSGTFAYCDHVWHTYMVAGDKNVIASAQSPTNPSHLSEQVREDLARVREAYRVYLTRDILDAIAGCRGEDGAVSRDEAFARWQRDHPNDSDELTWYALDQTTSGGLYLLASAVRDLWRVIRERMER